MEGNGPSSPDGSNPEEEEEDEDGGGVIPEYEKQRLSRIQENRARLEALGLPKLASSLLGSVRKQRSAAGSKCKRKSTSNTNKKRGRDADDEYLPSEEDEQEGESSPPSEEDEQGDYKPSPGSNRKGKRKILTKAKVIKTSCGKEKTADINDIDDVALQQAISLSLGQATGDLGSVLGQLSQGPGTSSADAPSRRKGKASTTETARGRNTRKENKSRVQLTDDEVAAYFFTFDGVGDGLIAFRDLQRMAATHDFIWTDTEMAHMIQFFDSDGDGKLSLNDFQTIVSRCNMLQEPKEC